MPGPGDDSVPVDFFYDALSPYGDWIYTPNYGYVWQPLVAQQPGWAPYTDGSWAYTDAGWTWISNEEFGWLTYHYGRWIQMQQSWVWVPGYDWAPAWVSWRQTQGQIGWAPLPPEAAWAPGTGFGNWTDSYYDVGPAYYNFVPYGMFASATSLLPYILDRSLNYNYYNQSVNITNTIYQPNVMNHIFVGGPDPRRFDGLGGNPLRRLTLRRDDEGFRRDWLEHRGNGGPPRGVGNLSRIEQGQLFVGAPIIRRGPSQGLPARVREPFHQPVIERGWRGMAEAPGMDRMRQQQRDEFERTRPPNLPEKHLQPATSTVPPPAFGRALQSHERIVGGNGIVGGTLPQPSGGTSGTPGRTFEEPGLHGGSPNLRPGFPTTHQGIPSQPIVIPQQGQPRAEHFHMQPQPGVPASTPATPQFTPRPMPTPQPQPHFTPTPQPPHFTPPVQPQPQPHFTPTPQPPHFTPPVQPQPHFTPTPQQPRVVPQQPHFTPPVHVMPQNPGMRERR